MESFKTEKQIRDYFKSIVFEFEIMCDGVADYKTVLPLLIDGNYQHFKVSLFPNENPFCKYDCLDGLLGAMQIFEVYLLNATTNEHTMHLSLIHI